MNKLLALIFSSGMIVGLSMASLAIITNVLLSEPISLHIALVWFSITSGLYTANRLIEGDKDAAVDNDISSTVSTCRPILLVLSLSLPLLAIIAAFHEKLELGLLIVFTILYFFLYTANPEKLIFKKGEDVLRITSA